MCWISSSLPRRVVARVQGLGDPLVVAPHFLKITVVGVGVELDRLVGVPVGLEQAQDEGVFQALEDAQVERAVFGVGDLDALGVQLGVRRPTSRRSSALSSSVSSATASSQKAASRWMRRVLYARNALPVQRQRDHQAEPHCGAKLERQAADAPPRAGLDQAEHARHLELLAQLADAEADLVADLVQRRQPAPGVQPCVSR